MGSGVHLPAQHHFYFGVTFSKLLSLSVPLCPDPKNRVHITDLMGVLRA